MRALEIFFLTGKPKSDLRAKPKYKVLKLGLNPDPETLEERIKSRVEKQFKRGLAEEVKGLLKRGYNEKLPALETLGYLELISALSGKISFEKANEDIKLHTRQFARRQMIWFRKEKNVMWFPKPLNPV